MPRVIPINYIRVNFSPIIIVRAELYPFGEDILLSVFTINK